MSQTFVLSSNHLLKSDLIRKVTSQLPLLPYKVHLQIHDIPFCFHVGGEEIIKELYDHYPMSWFKQDIDKPPLDVFWFDSRDLGFQDEAWEDEPSFECHVRREGEADVAVHRDFVGRSQGQQVVLICPYTIQDGFYNFLRWIAPLKFLSANKILLHSSCILDGHKSAYFCLGPSGAGKTTISTFRPRKMILGDDMNVLKIENGECWAQAGALGQALLNPREYSKWYPVAGMFWLRKGDSVEIKNLRGASQLKYLSTAVANVFWNRLDQAQTLRIFNFMTQILAIQTLRELTFPKNSQVWDQVFSQMTAKQE